jgi:hypothetical protein
LERRDGAANQNHPHGCRQIQKELIDGSMSLRRINDVVVVDHQRNRTSGGREFRYQLMNGGTGVEGPGIGGYRCRCRNQVLVDRPQRGHDEAKKGLGPTVTRLQRHPCRRDPRSGQPLGSQGGLARAGRGTHNGHPGGGISAEP